MKLKIIGLFLLTILCLVFILSYGLKLGFLYNTPLCILVFFICLMAFLLGLYCFARIKTEMQKKQNIFLCLFSAFMSLFLIYSFNIYKHNPQIPVNIEIFPANLKCEYSKGYDIYLKSIIFDGKDIYLQELLNNNKNVKLGKGHWDIPILILNSQLESNIKIKTKANKICIAFFGGNNTGKALIKINNKTYTQDTFYYNDNNQFGENSLYERLFIFNIDSNFTTLQKINKTFYIISYFLIFYLINYFLGLITLSINVNFRKKKISSISILIYSLPILFMGTLYLLVYYPAIMPFDSLMQWKQALLNQYSSGHPVFHTYLIHIMQKIWCNPACVVIFQILLLSFVIGFNFYKLESNEINRKILFLISTITALTPFTGIMLVSLWKDTLFSIALLQLILSLLLILIEKDLFFNSKLNKLMFYFALIFVSFIRYHGLFISIFALTFLLLSKSIRKKITKVFITFSIMSIIIFKFITSLNVYYEPFVYNQIFQIPMHNISFVIHNNGIISDENRQNLDKILPYDFWQNSYDKYICHNFIFSHSFLEKNKINSKLLLHTYFDILKDNKILVLKDLTNINSFWLKYKWPESTTFPFSFDIDDNNVLSIKHNVINKNLLSHSFSIKAKDEIYKLVWENGETRDLFFKPTLYFVIWLIGTFLFVLKNGIKSIIIAIPILLNLFFISISLPEMCTRYLFIFFLIYPLMILLPFLKLKSGTPKLPPC